MSLFRRKTPHGPTPSPGGPAGLVPGAEPLPPDLTPLLARVDALRELARTPDGRRAAAKALSGILAEASLAENLANPGVRRYRGPILPLIERAAALALHLDEEAGSSIGDAALYNRLAYASEVRAMSSAKDGVAPLAAMESVKAWLAKAAAVEPMNALVWRNIAYAERTAGNSKEEEAALRRATELAADDHDAWIDLADERLRHAGPTEAIRAYDRAIAADPQSEIAWTRKGQALFLAKDAEGALECFDRAIAANDAFAEAWRWKAIVLHMGKRPQEFAACAQRAMALGAEEDDLLYCWADHLRADGRPREALEVVDRILGRSPRNVGAIVLKGIIFRTLGKAAEAEAQFDLAIKLGEKQGSPR